MFHAHQVSSPLAPTPNQKPNFSIAVKNSAGQEILCADPRAIRSLILLMDQNAVNGGAAAHWGGPSALAEIISTLFAQIFSKSEWFNHYNFVNDIGHAENALYALRALYQHAGINFEELKKFRSFPSRLTGHGESHLFPEAVLLSNGPLGSAFPQSQGLAAADKLLGNDRATICLLSDGAFMEGEAKEALCAIPGLTLKGKLNPYLLVISYNDTKLSGRIKDDSFSLEDQLNALEKMGWDLRKVQDGHHLNTLYTEFEKSLKDLKNKPQKPLCLLVRTVKGHGLEKTAKMASGGHGYPLKKYDAELHNFLKELWNNEVPETFSTWANLATENTNKSTPSTVVKEKIQAGFGKAAIAARKKNLPVVSISADLQGSTGIAPFHKEFPQFSYDVGVAESNMVSMAAGMAKHGFVPIVDTFAAFGATKGNLPLVMASLSEAPVLALFSHIGFQDAADGASHQSLTYFSSLCSVPNTILISPASSTHAEKLVLECLEKMSFERSLRHNDSQKKDHVATNYVFYTGREDSPKSYGFEQNDVFGKPTIVIAGNDGYLVTQGNLLEEVMKAQTLLKNQGLDFGVIHHTYLNVFDKDFWQKTLKSSGVVISIEDHQEKGGIGSFLFGQIAQHLPGTLKKGRILAVQGKFGQSAYTSNELYQKHGLDASSIAKTAKEMLS